MAKNSFAAEVTFNNFCQTLQCILACQRFSFISSNYLCTDLHQKYFNDFLHESAQRLIAHKPKLGQGVLHVIIVD